MPPRTKPMARTSLRVTSTEASVKPKLRKCKVCRQPFEKRSMSHIACSVECARIIVSQANEKVERKETAERREAIKPRAKWLAEAQAAFNGFIRARDALLPCVSCGRFHLGAHDAGHYRSVGAMPALRFHEDNVHRQCVPCNQHKAGNILEYRLGLIAKIGVERVTFLEGPHGAMKYTIEDAKAIKATYKAKLKELQRAAA
jgi:hypothetical protein